MGRFSLIAAFLVLAGTAPAAPPAPLAHWPLLENGADASGNGCDAENHGVLFGGKAPDGGPAARFNGRDAFLEASADALPGLGAGDFTLSMWICTETALDDAVGDLLGKFDPETRRGVNLSVPTLTGVSNSQPNHRTLHFGIDNGAAEPQWTFRGRPGNAVFVFGFAVHDGSLYAATCEPGAGQAGHVYRFLGGAGWEDCGSPDGSNAVAALAVHDGALYAGTSWYDTTGSSLEASPNTTPGGAVYRYGGGKSWAFCGRLSNPETGTAVTMGGLAEFRGTLYATTLKQDGFGLYQFVKDGEWHYCGNPGRRVLNPCMFNGSLYMVSYDAPGGPFRHDGNGWAYVGGGITPPIHQDYAFAVYGGLLHLSTWPEAHVYRMEQDGTWTLRGRPGEELETMGMMVYNGKLYTGTLPSSKVYRLDGDAWTPIGAQLDSAGGKYRRAWSMALYDGKLFCGTLPSGNVHSLDAGLNTTFDRALEPGWRHIAAVRDGNTLRLCVDGKTVAEHKAEDGPLDASNGAPLKIGFGAGDYFNGWMRDVRVHGAALTNGQIRSLYRAGRGGR